ncbi:Regulator of ribonuclease activity B [Sphingopyxis sp. YR583]|uniref:ribonuclease E inhibitor RraB n=1 Tax=Sphingopyxis sp. YR583 TaxID=1881047 RepID=UPI0008A7D30E|nr:ribonuclease E inhibitor RraB [Sphingopyxis sp. YR583]SEH12923.1 Regulator of ribonuclease activity B [Sphingopyxis sp. YR583]
MIRRISSYLETDAEKLEHIVHLEKSWSILGPLREINFQFRFCNPYEDRDYCPEASAQRNFDRLINAGFEARRYEGDGGHHVTVSTHIEPSLEKINAIEKQLDDLIDDDYFYYDGWSYPDLLEIRFWPTSRTANLRSNFNAAINRGRVLFGERLLKDPLGTTSDVNFQMVPSKFLRLAEKRRPRDPQPTASAFSQWIYSLYADAWGNEQDRERGKETEKAVWELRQQAETSLDPSLLRKKFQGWTLVHNGLHLERNMDTGYFTIASLEVGGTPLRASPDLVYRHEGTGEILIVELKNSYLPLPANLWPNLWGQLWCYAQIDAAARAPKVTVVGEVWASHKLFMRGSNPIDAVSLRASQRRDPRTPAYDRFFRSLFDIYRGVSPSS